MKLSFLFLKIASFLSDLENRAMLGCIMSKDFDDGYMVFETKADSFTGLVANCIDSFCALDGTPPSKEVASVILMLQAMEKAGTLVSGSYIDGLPEEDEDGEAER